MTDLQTTIEYYKDLILYQYINFPKARATIDLLVRQGLVDFLPLEVNDAFDLDSAVGSQLDILGEYIGFDRVVITPIVRTYMKFDDAENLAGTTWGFTDLDNATVNASVSLYSYVDALGSSTSLSDDEFRTLLKLKVTTNMSSNTLKSIADILYGFFSTDLIFLDHLDMTASYAAKNTIARLASIALQEGFLPKPMGVDIAGIFEIESVANVMSFHSDYSTIGFSDLDTTATGYFLDYGDKYNG